MLLIQDYKPVIWEMKAHEGVIVAVMPLYEVGETFLVGSYANKKIESNVRKEVISIIKSRYN